MATDVFFGADIVESKTEEEVLQEIQELERQQREISYRLKSFRGSAGRGNRSLAHGFSTAGRGFMGSGMGIGGRGRGKHPRTVNNSEEVEAEAEELPAKKRLLSSVIKVNDDTEMNYDVPPENEYGPESNTNSHRNEEEEAPVPRVLPVINDAGLIKRNRRMFGALLLGTLEKFKEEDKKLQDSDAFLRRSITLKRAEQKAMEESEKLRQEANQRFQERKKRDMVLKARLEAKTEEKQLQILYMRWNSHHTKLSSFLRTKSQPCVYFVPAKPSDTTDKLLEEQKRELEEWKATRLSEIKSYHDSIKEEYIQSATNERPAVRPNLISSTATLVVRDEEGEEQEGGEKAAPAGSDPQEQDKEMSEQEEPHEQSTQQADAPQEDPVLEENVEVEVEEDKNTESVEESGLPNVG